MRNRDGLTLNDAAGFADDVRSQIARRKLRLGASEGLVRSLLPAIEAAMAENGVAFEHSALNGVPAGQLVVVRIDGRLHRLGIATAPRWEPGAPPRLHADSMWCGVDGANGTARSTLDLVDGVGPDEIDAFMAGFVAKTRVDAAR